MSNASAHQTGEQRYESACPRVRLPRKPVPSAVRGSTSPALAPPPTRAPPSSICCTNAAMHPGLVYCVAWSTHITSSDDSANPWLPVHCTTKSLAKLPPLLTKIVRTPCFNQRVTISENPLLPISGSVLLTAESPNSSELVGPWFSRSLLASGTLPAPRVLSMSASMMKLVLRSAFLVR